MLFRYAFICKSLNSSVEVLEEGFGDRSSLKKRGWVDISIDILESAASPTNKTRLMYRSNLNYVRFNAYFSDFLRKGLLEAVENSDGNAGPAYRISKQGKILLAALRNAEKLFSEG